MQAPPKIEGDHVLTFRIRIGVKSIMADYLFIGAPTESGASKSSTFKTLRDRTTPSLADVFELKVPETLKVGTQDSLVAVVEEMHKIDTMAEQVMRQIARAASICTTHCVAGSLSI